MDQPPFLPLRRSARYDVALRARVEPAADARPAVQFSAALTRRGPLEVDIVDISSGGVGLLSGLFIPRGCPLDLRIMGLGGEVAEELVAVRARVHRVIMTDRRPAYLVGASFEQVDEAQAVRLNWLVSQFGKAA